MIVFVIAAEDDLTWTNHAKAPVADGIQNCLPHNGLHSARIKTSQNRISDTLRRPGEAVSPGQFQRAGNIYTRRSTIIFLISAIALAGFSPFGHALEQFMMV